MRVSNQQSFDVGLKSLQDHAANVMKYQIQISSGKQYQNVSDNPSAVGAGLALSYDKAQFQMYQKNQQVLTDRYTQSGNQIQSIYTQMVAMRQVVAQAEGASADLAPLATKAAALRDAIKSMASASDAYGNVYFRPVAVGSMGQAEIEPNVKAPQGIAYVQLMGTVSVTNNAGGSPNPETGYTDVMSSLNAIVVSLQSGKVPTDAQRATLDAAVKQVLAAQTTNGLYLKQIEAATDAVESKVVSLDESLASLLDTDIASASANLTREQALLQAAQNIFAKIQSTNLFDQL